MLNIFNTSPEVAESAVDTAVLALGSVEPKGPHLPAGLDMLIADRFARDFCRGKAVYLLPTWPFSMGVETRGFRGAATLSQQTMWDVLFDIAGVLARHRFKRFIVLDFSSYNWIVKHAVREINLNKELLHAVWVNPIQFAKEAADEAMLPDYGGGAVETSLAMEIAPKLVGEAPADFDPAVPREYIDYSGLRKVAAEGYWGRPAAASAENGRKLYNIMIEKTAEHLHWALHLFPDGDDLKSDSREEVWWPGGAIPGAEGPGLDWRDSISAIAASSAEIAVLGTSATEQHSASQPLGTDYLACLELTRGVADALGAYLLPAVPIITSWGHIHFRGTLTLSAMTARRVIGDLVASLHEGGFRKVAIINVHGGNWVVKPTLIELNHAYPDMRIVTTGDILSYRGQAVVPALHADVGEGSFIKGFYPKAFKDDKVFDFSPMCSAAAFDLVGIGGVSPRGMWGNQTDIDGERARTKVEERIKEVSLYIEKSFADIEGLDKRRAR